MTCALCSLPLTPPSVRSQVLDGDFHEACYDAAWKLKDVRAQQDEGWQVEAWCSRIPVHAGGERAAIQDADPTRFDVLPTIEGKEIAE